MSRNHADTTHRTLVRMMLLAVAAAIATIALKFTAAVITGSVGLLSDALESVVNLVAALVGLWAVRVASQPPDGDHHFGHGKAEYLSAALEGGLISVAAAAIVWTSIDRLMNPMPLDHTGFGLVLSAIAALINLIVGLLLIRVGKRERSIALTADGRHLLTDVVTSAGVLVGVGLVAIFGWDFLDPLAALAVGAYIAWTGWQILQRSVIGLLDAALPEAELQVIRELLDRYRAEAPIDFHELRTRESGRQRFVYIHLLVPDGWTVKKGHALSLRVADDIAKTLPDTRSFVHIEPIGQSISYDHGPELAPADVGTVVDTVGEGERHRLRRLDP